MTKHKKISPRVVFDDDDESIGYIKVDKYNGSIVKSLAEQYSKLLTQIGENPKREGLVKTPERVAKSIQYLTHGYDLDPEAILLSAMFKEKYNQMVIVKDIEDRKSV